MSVLQGLQNNYQKFQKLNTEILAICVDPVDTNQKVKKKLSLSFEILSDSKFQTVKAYGLLHAKPMGIGHPIARPAEFLLDKNGVVFQKWLPDSIYGRTHPSTILNEIQRMEGMDIQVSMELPSPRKAIGAKKQAPEFSLADTTGKMRSLSEFSGKNPVILTFIRGYWSKPCISFLESIQSQYKAFQSLHAEILVISIDSVEANKSLRQRLNLSFEILSDPKLKMIRAYGMDQEKPKGLDHPIARSGGFLLDKKGVIFQGWLPDRADQRTAVDTMLADVKRLLKK